MLKGLITFSAFHGPWKSPVYINAKEKFVGDLHLNNGQNNNDLPSTFMTISRIGLLFLLFFFSINFKNGNCISIYKS